MRADLGPVRVDFLRVDFLRSKRADLGHVKAYLGLRGLI